MKFLLSLLLCSSCFASDWVGKDTQWEVAWQLVNLADWSQTLDLTQRKFYVGYSGIKEWPYYDEYNPILGAHPSRAKVNHYFFVSAVAHVMFSNALPRRWRRTYQGATLGLSAACVVRNHYVVGVRVKF